MKKMAYEDYNLDPQEYIAYRRRKRIKLFCKIVLILTLSFLAIKSCDSFVQNERNHSNFDVKQELQKEKDKLHQEVNGQ